MESTCRDITAASVSSKHALFSPVLLWLCDARGGRLLQFANNFTICVQFVPYSITVLRIIDRHCLIIVLRVKVLAFKLNGGLILRTSRQQPAANQASEYLSIKHGYWLVDCGLSTIYSGLSAYQNYHTVPSGQGVSVAMSCVQESSQDEGL